MDQSRRQHQSNEKCPGGAYAKLFANPDKSFALGYAYCADCSACSEFALWRQNYSPSITILLLLNGAQVQYISVV